MRADILARPGAMLRPYTCRIGQGDVGFGFWQYDIETLRSGERPAATGGRFSANLAIAKCKRSKGKMLECAPKLRFSLTIWAEGLYNRGLS
jgi:hypothetical protein